MLVTMIVAIITVVSILTVNDAALMPHFLSPSQLKRFQSAMVTCDAAPCAFVGKDILKNGGTAVDSAIATLICMGAVHPESSGIGGGFLMLFYNRTEKKSYFIDAREAAPAKATVKMYATKIRKSLKIGVPGEVAGFERAYKRFGGGVKWKDLFKATIKMCKKGMKVSAHLANALQSLRNDDDINYIFMKRGTFFKEGDTFKRPDLAKTLEEISLKGKEAIYGRSDLSKKLLKDLKDQRCILQAGDMQNYTARLRKSVVVPLNKSGYTVHTVSTPGSGVLLAYMLSILDGYSDMDTTSFHDDEKTTKILHRLIETMKFAYAQKGLLEDNKSEMKKFIRTFTSRKKAEETRRKINDYWTYHDPKHYGHNLNFVMDKGTAHLNVVAPNGDAVAVTTTVNNYFGSKVWSPLTGIILNSQMMDFNRFDDSPSAKNKVKPGKRPISSIAPVIFTDKKGNARLILGASGGPMILSSVMQVTARNLYFGENIKQSIDAPRLHHQLIPDVLFVDKHMPTRILHMLRNQFFHRPTDWLSPVSSIVLGIEREENGWLTGNCDYRKGGAIAGY